MQKKILLFFILIAIILGIYFGGRYLLSTQKQQGKAGLQVNSDPPASVFLDSRFLGRTPFQDRIEPGEYTLKLIPESTATSAASWQGKISLNANVLTYVNRQLGTSDITSAGEVISLEKLSGRDTEISVVTLPDGASVKIDGEDKGTAPILLRNVEPAEHEILVSSTGYLSRSVKVKTTAGFKLTATVQLGVIPGTGPQVKGEETIQENITTTPGVKPTGTQTANIDKPYVEILDTPTGFLRVRAEPSTAASETARVKPKEQYSLLKEQSGWYKIKLNDGSEGWIKGDYAKKVE